MIHYSPHKRRRLLQLSRFKTILSYNNNEYYGFCKKESLINLLKRCNLIIFFQIISDILAIIVEFYGLYVWNTQLHNHLLFELSNDNVINNVLIPEIHWNNCLTNSNYSFGNEVVYLQTPILIHCKLNYAFEFKIYKTIQIQKAPWFYIGVVNSKINKNKIHWKFGSMKDHNKENSLFACFTGDNCYFTRYNTARVQLMDDNFDEFTLNINLTNNTMNVKCNGFLNHSKMLQHSIPTKLIKNEQYLWVTLRYCSSVMLFYHKFRQRNHNTIIWKGSKFGIGLVCNN